MLPVNTLVITGYGTNSHRETARAAVLAGSEQTEEAHFSDIVSGRVKLNSFGLLVFPGGFIDGDDLGAAQAAAMRWRWLNTVRGEALLDILSEFLDRGHLILGICNGFQLLVKLGLLPMLEGLRFQRQVSLGHNLSGRYEDRWVYLKSNLASPCVFTKNLPPLYLPVRHGEGRIVAETTTLHRIEKNNLIALQYINPQTGEVTTEYPYNPNGSPLGIAGLTNTDGHILGLMPHPEAFHHVTNHPRWTRGELTPPGTLFFVNAIRYLKNN